MGDETPFFFKEKGFVKMKKKWKILVTLVLVLFFVGIISVGTLLILGMQDKLPLMGKKVAVIPIKGEITTGSCQCNILGCVQCAQVKVVKAMLETADRDSSIRAIVLDINSGGGGVIASSEMMKEVKETKKPVVARIEEVGASGAYYVASAADKIVAHRNSFVGGVGVVMYLQQYYGLMEKLGVNVTVIKSGENKDIGSPYRPMREEEREELQGMVDLVYENLIQDIAENRNMSVDYIDNVSQGALYLGIEAKEAGLVDELGNLEDAIILAGELGGIEGEPKVITFSKKKSLFEELIGK